MNITEFANYLCVSRQNLTIHMRRLTEEGLLKVEGSKVTLLSDEIDKKYSEIEMQ
jgi:Mn-dependent DtxR family transcriptional regulator